MNIRINHDLHPEDNAMVQALYSRSPASVGVHLEKVNRSDSGKFFNKYVINYGHESIGDCATTTIFIEGVSMIAAKCIQNHSLYNGQECSTRFIDFDKQGVTFNIDQETAMDSGMKQYKLSNEWMALYRKYMPHVRQGIANMTGRDVTEKSVEVETFDIMRGFLPCAAKTNLSWTTSLRNARAHVKVLAASEYGEVRSIGRQLHKALLEKYPNSFSADDLEDLPNTDTSPREPVFQLTHVSESLAVNWDLFDTQAAFYYVDECTPQNLPRESDLLGTIRYACTLDFGSYRDIQRHRNGYCSLPKPLSNGFVHFWYMNKVEEALSYTDVSFGDFFDQVDELVERAYSDTVHHSDSNLIYSLPMGIMVRFTLAYSLRQSIYVSELRSGPAVHATLRELAQVMGHEIEQELGLKLKLSNDETDYDRRSNQTIQEK